MLVFADAKATPDEAIFKSEERGSRCYFRDTTKAVHRVVSNLHYGLRERIEDHFRRRLIVVGGLNFLGHELPPGGAKVKSELLTLLN